jgi:hypothetical protein
MRMNLIEDLKIALEHDLNRLGCKISNTDSAHDLLTRWFDYKQRMIAPVPRQVEGSGRFSQSRKKLSTDENLALDAIIKKLKSGDDVNGHLSKDILNADRPDLLMADWKIHHVHISNTKKLPGDFFFKRADHLAFAIVNSASVYFLDIFSHGEENVWSKDDLLKIVKESRPSLLEGREFVGRLEPDIPISSAERDQLRRAGINVPTVLGDSIVFPPGGGITAAGTPISATLQANKIWNTLAEVQLYLDHPDTAQELAGQLGCNANEISLRLTWKDGEMFLQEETTGKYMKLDGPTVSKRGAEVVRRRMGR